MDCTNYATDGRHKKGSPTVPMSVVQAYSSVSPVRILRAELVALESVEDRHVSRIHSKDASLVTRRGCSVVLQLHFSQPLSVQYTTTLTFIPAGGPLRERSSTFRVSGLGKGSPELWLSIMLPTNFPVGHYDGQVSMSFSGCTEVIMHYIHSAVVVLFNPWNKGTITDQTDACLYAACIYVLGNSVGYLWIVWLHV